MTRRRLVTLVMWLALPISAAAQFGHPLDGLWSGQWGPRDKPIRLLLDLDWDGKNITGVINPGPDAATVKSVTVDYSDPSAWLVKLEAEAKDAAGRAIPVRVEGRLENIGVYRRVFRGTWSQGNQKSEFVVTRN